MKKLELPEELKLENYERRVQKAKFDRIDLVIEFREGLNGVGATVKRFMDAIPAHDAIVKRIEENLTDIEHQKRNYHKKNRLFRNLDSAWNLTLDNPVEFFEYQELAPKMAKVERRLEVVEDPTIKATLQNMVDRFRAVEPKCSKQAVIYETFSQARAVKDEAMASLLKAEAELKKLFFEEKHIASSISDDHIIADKQKQILADVFPNIHVGFILSSLNGDPVANLPYQEVINKVLRSKSPHQAEFLRYDYRYDPFQRCWASLAELRSRGVCVEDPLFGRIHFVNTAAKGDLNAMYQLLMSGEDPNSCDLSGNTALVMAAANKHTGVVELLVNAGADVNCRDKNMMTPLLFSVNRGYMEVVRQLVDMGADRDASDKNGRNALYYAVVSGNEAVVRLFLGNSRVNEKDSLWGFTPLHLSASLGNLPMVNSLLTFGCSIYVKDNRGRTPEEVAVDARRVEVGSHLKGVRHSAPGQVAHYDSRSRSHIWIGDAQALRVRWCADADISAVLFLRAEEVPLHAGWLHKDEAVRFQSYRVEQDDVDKSTESWEALRECVPQILAFVSLALAEGDANLLICDETGNSLAPAALALLLLMREQARVRETLQRAGEARPSVCISLSLRRGLDRLQKSSDDKVLLRLGSKLQDSVVLSCAF